MQKAADIYSPQTVLPLIKPLSMVVQIILLLSAAFLLPAAAHATGLPVRWLLPMHWPVILAGLCYGWRSGLLVGIGAPVLSYLVSGMPPLFMLPAMTVELAAYGFIAGFAREGLKLNGFLSAALSLIGGRIVFLAIVLITGAVAVPFADYLQAAMLPGIPAAIAQLILLPLIANWWVGRGSEPDES